MIKNGTLLILFFVVTTTSSIPFMRDLGHERPLRIIRTGDECDQGGKIVNDDPCSPWCVCIKGAALCSQVFCSTEIPSNCGKITVSGRCCPTLLCSGKNGTAFVRYDLPHTIIPAGIMGSDDFA